MYKRRSRFAPALSASENALENRVVLSGITAASVTHNTGIEMVARPSVARTQTSITANAGTLGQPITFTVTVRAPASAGSPQGSVNLVDHGTVIQSLALSPATSPNPRFAISTATYRLTQSPGAPAYFIGKHSISAFFIPAGPYSNARATKSFVVPKPAYTTLAGGVKVATIKQGSGPAIGPGQTAGVLYTGYLSKNGHIFDDSSNHGGLPINFTLGTGQVIPGFDEGVTGMQVGETRIVSIPPAEGYGNQANGPIPGHSTLIFVLTLESIGTSTANG